MGGRGKCIVRLYLTVALCDFSILIVDISSLRGFNSITHILTHLSSSCSNCACSACEYLVVAASVSKGLGMSKVVGSGGGVGEKNLNSH